MTKVTREDISGKIALEKVKMGGIKKTKKDDVEILTIEKDGEELSIGIVGDGMLDKMLEKHSESTDDGNFIELPVKAISDAKKDKIGWVNELY